LNARNVRPGAGVTFRRLRSLAGLAAAIVPFAIIVHLVAEAAAVGRDGLCIGFLVRHSYFGGLFLAAVAWFGSTAGLNRPARERRRRCALLRADLKAAGRPHSLIVLIGANVAFFGLTQAVEGMPIASGALALALGVALAGSLLAALLVFLFGESIAAAGLESVIGTAPLHRGASGALRREWAIIVPRRATSAFSLFVPNRPPPTASQL